MLFGGHRRSRTACWAHQYMLTVGSALWTTYDQFWGSVLVYIVAATLTPISHHVGSHMAEGVRNSF
jgi:hypothetical protein